MPTEIKSIQQWLTERGHHPSDVVNGESLLDLLWAFWVFNDDERRLREKVGRDAD